jgi:hypothetical protein
VSKKAPKTHITLENKSNKYNMWVLHITDITKTAGRVEHNHNITTAGRYNIYKEGASGRLLVRGRDFKNKSKNKF